MGLTQRLGTIPLAIQTDSSNNVGIGANPISSTKFYVLGNTTNYGITSENPSGYGGLTLKQISGNSWSLGVTSNNLFFYDANGGATRMTLTGAGNVGIGTSSPDYKLTINGGPVKVTDGTREIFVNPAADFGGGSNPAIQVVTNHALQFATNNTERMRITSGGQVLVNKTSSLDSSRKMDVDGNYYSSGSGAGYFWENRSNAANHYGWYTSSGTIYLWNGSANCASINPSNGIYTPLSDVNKKKDFEESTIGLDAILGLKPTLFRMKGEDESTPKTLGFIAQEVKEFIPQAYQESDDFIGLSDRPIIAALVKAIQEQQAQIEELKALINK